MQYQAAGLVLVEIRSQPQYRIAAHLRLGLIPLYVDALLDFNESKRSIELDVLGRVRFNGQPDNSAHA